MGKGSELYQNKIVPLMPGSYNDRASHESSYRSAKLFNPFAARLVYAPTTDTFDSYIQWISAVKLGG